ncbi:hypothetical protein Cs7R123_50410 [Catellatospora sp. TT07R-123]|nr:hypothetical protein Cs7R123_50410 [Catellatospora sp. TT07R-123]
MLVGYVAAFRWKPPAAEWTRHLPAEVVSVSECLTDFLPQDQEPFYAPWHQTWQEAAEAAGQALPEAGKAHVLGMSVPESGAAELTVRTERWTGHPIQVNLAQPSSPPPGTDHGFEVLGFEHGRFHSWLCYSLHHQAFDRFGIRPNDRGLLATLAEARQVAEFANINRDMPDGTPLDVHWLPALVTEHDQPRRE